MGDQQGDGLSQAGGEPLDDRYALIALRVQTGKRRVVKVRMGAPPPQSVQVLAMFCRDNPVHQGVLISGPVPVAVTT
jgi:hypothetical protein